MPKRAEDSLVVECTMSVAVRKKNELEGRNARRMIVMGREREKDDRISKIGNCQQFYSLIPAQQKCDKKRLVINKITID